MNVEIQVSFKRHNIQIQVMEPVHGLTILDCCDAAIPVGVKRTFVANIQRGKPVHYLWTFDLHHLNKAAHMSQEVTCLCILNTMNNTWSMSRNTNPNPNPTTCFDPSSRHLTPRSPIRRRRLVFSPST